MGENENPSENLRKSREVVGFPSDAEIDALNAADELEVVLPLAQMAVPGSDGRKELASRLARLYKRIVEWAVPLLRSRAAEREELRKPITPEWLIEIGAKHKTYGGREWYELDAEGLWPSVFEVSASGLGLIPHAWSLVIQDRGREPWIDLGVVFTRGELLKYLNVAKSDEQENQNCQ